MDNIAQLTLDNLHAVLVKTNQRLHWTAYSLEVVDHGDGRLCVRECEAHHGSERDHPFFIADLNEAVHFIANYRAETTVDYDRMYELLAAANERLAATNERLRALEEWYRKEKP
jgi:hypothetical protein